MNKYGVFLSVLLAGFIGISTVWASDDKKPEQQEQKKINLVLELFTSQGCPNSPPADSLLRSINKRDGVLALTWPVDYWDRLGWQDTMAKSKYSNRQAAYNKHLGKSGVTTPQMILNGKKAVKGSKKRRVMDYVKMFEAKEKLAIHPDVSVDKGRILVSLPSSGSKDQKDLFVRLVYFTDNLVVDITKGQNRGRTLHYANVVTYSPDSMAWDGKATQMDFPVLEQTNGATHLAVVIQKGFNHGQVLGASTLKLPKK